jgi:hypothetical protein
MRLALLVVGFALVAIGLLWILQGANMIGGSFMTGQTQWLYIGIATTVVGAAVVIASRRIGRA